LISWELTSWKLILCAHTQVSLISSYACIFALLHKNFIKYKWIKEKEKDSIEIGVLRLWLPSQSGGALQTIHLTLHQVRCTGKPCLIRKSVKPFPIPSKSTVLKLLQTTPFVYTLNVAFELSILGSTSPTPTPNLFSVSSSCGTDGSSTGEWQSVPMKSDIFNCLSESSVSDRYFAVEIRL